MSGLIIQYAFTHVDENRKHLSEYETMEQLADYLKKQNMVDKFATYAEKNGLKRRNLMIQKSHKLLERYIVSRIIYNMQSEQSWMEYLNSDDPAILETLKLFREGKAFPQAPEKKDKKVAQLRAFDYHGTHQKATYTACLS
jgi:carboxyl-terminal processing protease